MASPYSLSEAYLSDASAIANLFALSWTSPFTQLQFGHVEPAALAAAMAPQIAEHMQKPNIAFIVARHSDTQEVVSVAQWSAPVDGDDGEQEKEDETAEDKEERQHLADETYRNKLPKNSNKDLIMEFTIGLRKLRERTLGNKKRYRMSHSSYSIHACLTDVDLPLPKVLENIATHPDHRGHGLASKLVQWYFLDADKRGLVIYLDTASDNAAMRLYEKLGFQKRDSQTIEDLSKYGGEGSETHVALIRDPQSSS